MRITATALGAAVLVAALALPAEAQGKSRKRHAYKPPQGHQHAAPRQDSGYTEQLADKMRFGSSAWWEQMRREGRLGGETP